MFKSFGYHDDCRGAAWSLRHCRSIAVMAQITPELIEAAKKEGEVMFYGAITSVSPSAIGDLFEKKYGITVKHWRGDATEIVNRVLTEARAGKPAFDVTLGNEVVMQALDEKAILGVFDPPAAKGYPKQFLDPDKRMTAVAGVALRHQLQSSDWSKPTKRRRPGKSCCCRSGKASSASPIPAFTSRRCSSS